MYDEKDYMEIEVERFFSFKPSEIGELLLSEDDPDLWNGLNNKKVTVITDTENLDPDELYSIKTQYKGTEITVHDIGGNFFSESLEEEIYH